MMIGMSRITTQVFVGTITKVGFGRQLPGVCDCKRGGRRQWLERHRMVWSQLPRAFLVRNRGYEVSRDLDIISGASRWCTDRLH